MRFLIMNGAGNRFGIIDARGREDFSLSETQIVDLAKKGGVLGAKGADQIIILRKPKTAADIFMDIYNADGSVSGACGNATRCIGWLLLHDNKPKVKIETISDILLASKDENGNILVDMGVPKLDWQDIPLAEYMDTIIIDVKLGPIDNPVLSRPGAVNMGNPHCVFFVDSVKQAAVDKIGPMIEYHPLFPEQCNVGFAEIIDDNNMELRVWERGVGETKACGTGACAALVAANRQGRIGRQANIHMPGGILSVYWRDDGHVILGGPVELEGEGEV